MCSNRRMGVLHLCLGHYDTPTDQPNNQKADMMVKKVVTIPLSFRGRDGEIRICSIFLLQRYALLIIFELPQNETKPATPPQIETVPLQTETTPPQIETVPLQIETSIKSQFRG